MSESHRFEPTPLGFEISTLETEFHRMKRPIANVVYPFEFESENFQHTSGNEIQDIEHLPLTPLANSRLVVDMLVEIKEMQLAHDKRAATALQVDSQGKKIQTAMLEQEKRLKETISEMKSYLEKFSARRRFTTYSAFAVAIATAILTAKLLWGDLTIIDSCIIK